MDTKPFNKVGMIGLGKLGFPVALAIESKGYEVVGYDVATEPSVYLTDRKLPYMEKGVQPLLDKTELLVANKIDTVVEECDLIFLAIQTPHDREYEGDTRVPQDRKDFNYMYLKNAVETVADYAKQQEKKITLAVISTCLPGTFKREIEPLLNEYVEYVYTPQFIAMGTVLNDYLDPEFNLIGVQSYETAHKMARFYDTINKAGSFYTDITTAEGIKVFYNTFITMKTVLGNIYGEMAYKLGMNADDIYECLSLATGRLLSPKYLRSGVGDGGGCHPRDNIALSYLAREVGLSHNIFEDLMQAREDHMDFIAREAIKIAGKKGKKIVILGKSFKPETNIETGSPAILLKNLITEKGVAVEQYEDLDSWDDDTLYVIATQHARYKDYPYPRNAVVLDPFRYIPDRGMAQIIQIGAPKVEDSNVSETDQTTVNEPAVEATESQETPSPQDGEQSPEATAEDGTQPVARSEH